MTQHEVTLLVADNWREDHPQLMEITATHENLTVPAVLGGVA
jgi:hypothetical protein